uniref:NodB homology domain-containing protein n=1 Tax=Angiostrongylus cantonensis TaxID=6313 RepID=A0A0K0D0S1_ANGCA
LLLPCPDDGSCKLAQCFCSFAGTEPPGSLNVANVPQMVILSFDDAITDRTINVYKSLFNGKVSNFCATATTFFVASQPKWMWPRNRFELNNVANKSKERWRHEMIGLKESLEAFSYVDKESIKGVRAPQLLIGGDAQFEMMEEEKLWYDNSMPVNEGPLWPQTLDHSLPWDCSGQNCPRRPHKGIWMIPLQLLQANNGIWYNTAKAALKPTDSRSSVVQFLRNNFYRNYNTNRAPFILTADTDFLTYLPDNGVVSAINDWLTEVRKKDVYVVTAKQVISWMQTPVALSEASKFKPWQCERRLKDHMQPCEVISAKLS